MHSKLIHGHEKVVYQTCLRFSPETVNQSTYFEPILWSATDELSLNFGF